MNAYRYSQENKGEPRETEERQPLDNAQLNAVMRNAFAWMTVGLGISAWIASVLSASGLDALTMLSVLMIGVILQLGLAFSLYDELRWFSPKRASIAFIVYAIVLGVNASFFFSLLAYPEPSFKSVALYLSLASLSAVLTLTGWKSKLDFSESSAYFLMGLIGLPVAAAVNYVSGKDGDGLAVSLVSVILFSTLTAFMTERIAGLGADARATVNPDDAARFSVLAALKLYLSVTYVCVVLPLTIFKWLATRRTGYHGDYDGGGFSLFGDDGGDAGDFGGFDGDFGGD